MKDKPFISVVIPAYNEEKYLTHALESLSRQDYPKNSYEVIVVDNGSTDKTPQLATNLGVKVLSFTEAKGVSPARQFGFENSKGEIIASMDADSIADEKWLIKISEAFRNKNIVCVGGVGRPQTKNLVMKILFWIYHIFLRINLLFGKALLWGFNFAVRKDAFEEVGGFNTLLSTSEDWDLALRLQKKFGTKSVIYTPSLVVYTSIRKQKQGLKFIKYFLSGVKSYINIVILNRSEAGEMIDVR